MHESQSLIIQGTALDNAKTAMILIHGRGSNPHDILSLRQYFPQPEMAYLAPQAENSTWYPQRFIVPRDANEPYLSSALNTVGNILQKVQDAGIPAEKTVLLGFSQGACLALEYAARNPQRYGGVIALSGGLIGTDDELIGYEGSLNDTPVFLGCSDVDFHIPLERVHESTRIMQSLGAEVTERIYPGMGHTINEDEIQHVQRIIAGLI